jgi:SAM-dependent methyltransferase
MGYVYGITWFHRCRTRPIPHTIATTKRTLETTMGSADKQGELWGAAAQDWAAIAEPAQVPFYEAAFEAIGVGNGTNLLDVGCGAGLAMQLAEKRGATASGIDAAEGLLVVARERVPAAVVHHGDMEELPFADEAFDAVTAFNSVQYAADPTAALREIKRVAKPGAGVAVVTWGTADQCEMRVLLGAIGSLLPPPPPGAGGPFALAAPGALEALVEGAGLTTERAIDVPTPYIYPDLDTATRGQLSSGPARMAINTAGIHATIAAVREAMLTGTQADGTIRLDNVFKVVVARA